MTTVLSFDPGTHNCAFVVSSYENGRITLKTAGMIKNTLLNLTFPKFYKDLEAFKEELRGIIKEYKPDRAIIERFQNRGRNGKTIECVNIMIGVLTSEMKDKKTIPVVASQWKNKFNREAHPDLNSFYKEVKEFNCPPHILDSYLINLYGNSKRDTYKNLNRVQIKEQLREFDWKLIVKELNKFQKTRPR